MLKNLVITLSILVIVGAGCFQNNTNQTSGGSVDIKEGIAVGDLAPNFVLDDMEGNEVSLNDLRGQIVFIDFWASWCPFCLKEMVEIEEFSDKYDDVVVLGIHRSESETIDDVSSFLEETGVTYPILLDSEGEVFGAYSGGRPLMPLAYVLDKDGVIKERLFGPKTVDQMEAIINSLIDSYE